MSIRESMNVGDARSLRLYRQRALVLVLSMVPLLSLSGCGGGDTEPTSVLSSVTVTLQASTVIVGQSVTASVRGSSSTGGSISTGVATFTSSNPAVATVSAIGTVTALAPGQAIIVATVDGKQGQATLTVVPLNAAASVVTLGAPGQLSVYLDSPNFKANLNVQAGAQYLITVVNTNPSPAQREDFQLTGTFSTSPAVALLNAPLPARVSSASIPTPRASAALSSAEVNEENTHLEALQTNRNLFSLMGNPADAWARERTTATGRSAALLAPVTPTIGTINKVYVPRFGGTCSSADSIGARTVAVGQRVIVLADTNSARWPASLRPDSAYYQSFANEYDQVTYPHLIENIGDPLSYDNSLSKLGKVTVVITPLLNNLASNPGSNIVAFVSACDFYPPGRAATNPTLSNQTEVFYSWIPGTDGNDVVKWGKSLRATAAHESKHLVSYAERIARNSSNFEEVWLEEGTAQVSSEIWQRRFNQATWKGRATFQQTVACETNYGTTAPCNIQNDKPINLNVSNLPFFFQYLQTESSSRTEGLGVDSPSNYGAGWAFARWATDHYAKSTEGAFLKPLIDEPLLSGLQNLSLHTGESVTTMLTYWNLANGIFHTPTYTPSDVRATYPSFNFADIFSVGQSGNVCNARACRVYTASGVPVYPIQPITIASSGFSRSVSSVPGTSAVYLLLPATATGSILLQLNNTNGATLSAASGFRVAIMRVL